MNEYVLRQGDAAAYRLAILAGATRQSTFDFLRRLRIEAGMSCLDVGCGTGEVASEIAMFVGRRGLVVGVDTDKIALGHAQSKIAENSATTEFTHLDVRTDPLPTGFDFVYARFLLSHLADPIGTLRKMRASAKPGSIVAAEDIDFVGHICYPKCAAFDRYLELYQAVVRLAGGNPVIGPELPAQFSRAGFARIGFEVVTPTFQIGPAKNVAAVTMEHIREAIFNAKLADHNEVDNLVHELSEFAKSPSTIISISRIFQVWGTA